MSNRKTFPKWVPSARNWKETNTISFKQRFWGGKSFVDEGCEAGAAWAEQGLDGLGGKTVKLQRVEKPYLLKHTVWNGIFPSQIKMLKHNKYTVHLTSSQAPNCYPITFLPSTQSLFLLNSNPVSGFCASIKVRMCVHAWACVCDSVGTKKL